MPIGSLSRRFKAPLPSGSVLVLAAHPDDEVIGCGGALALHHRKGDRIKVVFATDGAGARPRRRRRPELARLRRREARAAGKILGVDEFEFWGYPDGRLSRADGVDERVKALLEREAPDVVYRPLAQDPNPDHDRLAGAFEGAARGRRLWNLGYEVWSLARRPSLIDITEVWALKEAALRRYVSQVRLYDYPLLVRRLNSARGLLLSRDTRYAEGFALGRAG